MTQEKLDPSINTVGGSFRKEPLTSGQGASSDGTEAESTTTFSMGWNKALRELSLDRDLLTPRSQAVLDLLVDDLSDGFTKTMLAAEHAQRPSWVSGAINELRDEVLLSSGKFWPLTEQEFEALKLSVEQSGILCPILVGDHSLIDGHHRLQVSKELGLRTVPVVRVKGLTSEQERELGLALNATRRHLTKQQKRSLIRSELVRDSSRSSRRIAVICGVDHKTVESVRRELAAEDYEPTEAEVEAEHKEMLKQIGISEPPKEKRVDSLGRERQAYVEDRRRKPMPVGHASCCHGANHSIFKSGNGFRLEEV